MQISGDEGAVRAGGLAFKGVQKASAFSAVLTRQRRWRRTFARTRDSESVGHVQSKRRGVAVGGIVRQRKPSGGKQQIGVFVADDGGAHARHGTVFFVGEQAGVGERQSDVATGSDGRRQSDHDVERIHRVAAKSHRFAVGCFYVADDQIGMKFDADAAGNVGGPEIDFCDGADGLVRGVERGGDIVVLREKADWPGRLGAKRSSGASERDGKQCSELNTNSSAEGHQTTFQWPCKMGTCHWGADRHHSAYIG